MRLALSDIGTILAYPWHLATIAGLVIATVYVFVWPKPPNTPSTTPRKPALHCVLRFGHSAVWILMTIFFAVRSGSFGIAAWLGTLAGVMAAMFYITFLIAFIYDRSQAARTAKASSRHGKPPK
jgi:type II secretory pathway component PulF